MGESKRLNRIRSGGIVCKQNEKEISDCRLCYRTGMDAVQYNKSLRYTDADLKRIVAIYIGTMHRLYHDPHTSLAWTELVTVERKKEK